MRSLSKCLLPPCKLLSSHPLVLTGPRVPLNFTRLQLVNMPSPLPLHQFSSSDFRSALGMFATGVTIVTAHSPEGCKVGLTVSSFNSVSESPPLVLWSLALKSRSLPAFSACSHFAIHVLTAKQQALAEQFSCSTDDRFKGVIFQSGASQTPLLEGCAAVFECINRYQYPGGDHLIFVGEVIRCWQTETAQPLLYHQGHFFSSLSA